MAENKVDMTQVEALHVYLQQSFSPDASVRDPAEASIKHLKFVPGATSMLLAITEEKQVCFDLHRIYILLCNLVAIWTCCIFDVLCNLIRSHSHSHAPCTHMISSVLTMST